MFRILEENNMATRIQATPILDRKESKRFSALVEQNLKRGARCLPTPKLRQAMRKAMSDVKLVR